MGSSGAPSPYAIDAQVDKRFAGQLDLELLVQAAAAVLAHQQVDEACELALLITGDEVLRELNRRYRGVDRPTDVLAFAEEGPEPFVDAPGLPRYLGDVAVSFPRAQSQAAEAGHAVEAELYLLVVHGVLHLLGYDDATDEQRAQMWDVQLEVLQASGVRLTPPA